METLFPENVVHLSPLIGKTLAVGIKNPDTLTGKLFHRIPEHLFNGLIAHENCLLRIDHNECIGIDARYDTFQFTPLPFSASPAPICYPEEAAEIEKDEIDGEPGDFAAVIILKELIDILDEMDRYTENREQNSEKRHNRKVENLFALHPRYPHKAPRDP